MTIKLCSTTFLTAHWFKGTLLKTGYESPFLKPSARRFWPSVDTVMAPCLSVRN